jgi:hypothetical protein
MEKPPPFFEIIPPKCSYPQKNGKSPQKEESCPQLNGTVVQKV